MNTFHVVIVAALMGLLGACEAGVLAAAPVPVAAAVGYAHAVPQNVPPFASRVDFETRVRAAPLIGLPVPAAAPVIAAPAPAPIVHAPAAPFVAAPAVAPALAPYGLPAFAPYALPAPFFRR